MAIYYQPPPAFVGGNQPLAANAHLPQAYVPDNPPFGQRLWLCTVLCSWQPPPPQPQQAPVRVVQGIAPPAVNDPPFGSKPWIFGVVGSWRQEPPPQPPRQYVVQGVAPADNPPFGARAWLSSTVAAWQPQPYQIPRLRTIVQSIDDPPFEAKRQLPESLWRRPDWPDQRRSQLVPIEVAAAADDPPFGQRPWLSGILRAWDPPAPQIMPWRGRVADGIVYSHTLILTHTVPVTERGAVSVTERGAVSATAQRGQTGGGRA